MSEFNLENTAANITSLQAQKEQIDEQITSLKQLILDNREPGSYEAGELKVQVREGSKRLDAKKFEATYPPTRDNAYLYKTAVDLKKVKENFSPADLEPFMTAGAPQVVIK